VIILSVRSEHELRNWQQRLTWSNVTHELFTEPDLNDAATSLAAIADPSIFKHLKAFK
jgi:hypothetical protein